MKSILKDLEERKQELNVLESQLEADCENEELESKCDKAYERYYLIAQEVAKQIVTITGGMIEFQTARRMAFEKSEDLSRLFA